MTFLQTEPAEPDQPQFSAAFGNIYTVMQLRQLFDEAFHRARLAPAAWRRDDGRWVDCYRPTVIAAGFASPAEVAAARAVHLEAVRTMFETCSVFVFTLGLTEGWTSADGRAVFPAPPGVVTDRRVDTEVRFCNFDYAAVLADLTAFIEGFHEINPAARIILTVSPVPLAATYTDEHVLTANTYSKSVLRAVCGHAERAWAHVYYFPSYEVVSGSYNGGAYYEADKRSVSPAGVAHVMRLFRRTYAAGAAAAPSMLESALPNDRPIVCDEELFATNVGF